LLIIDRTLCTGCGTCLNTCPTGAISLDDDERIARIDLGLCSECLACLDVCPNYAIRLSRSSDLMPLTPREIVEGELVEDEIIPAPVNRGRVAIRQPGPLVALAGSALSFVGSWLVPRAADALIDAVDRRLAGRGGSIPSTTRFRSGPQTSMRRMGGGRGGRSRQRRRRRRGGG